MKVYWSRCGYGEGNFGDRLTTFLLEHFGVRCEWAPPEHADLIGVGSVMERIPERFKGVVWTSGLMHAHSLKALPDARVVAVRGRLTLERLRGVCQESVLLGDGGLLSHLLLQPVRKRFKLGLVPHFVDASDPIVAALASKSSEITVIDVCRSPRAVIQAVAECEAVLSSSLHGLVAADSLGIPNCWMELNRGAQAVEGAGFKYRDYYSIFGINNPRFCRPTFSDSLDTLLPLVEGYARPGLADFQCALLRSLEAFVASQPAVSAADLLREQEEKRAWMAPLGSALRELAEIIPPNAKFIFVDEDQLRGQLASDQVIPFLEKGGQYWGPPADDTAAICELERLRQAGAGFIVFAWPSFWWLDHYVAFAAHLRTKFQCLSESEKLLVFDLRTRAAGSVTSA